MYPYDIDRIHMNTPGYTRIRKKFYFLGYTIRYTQDTAKYNLRANPPTFKSTPPQIL